MAVTGRSSVKSPRRYQGISSVLASAVLEWLLIFMLFIDAIFSYLITTFAYYCELQNPCLLCSRLDHILGNRKLKYYWDLICPNHKWEISSLVLCHAHGNLVDVHGICESCLFSFATINKSNAETYRLLVGKLGEDSSLDLDQDPLLEGHTSSARCCSCCKEAWIPRGRCQNLMQTKSVGFEDADLDAPLSGVGGDGQSSLKKSKRSVSFKATDTINGHLDPLSHVQYAELNVDSDTESKVLIFDVGNVASSIVKDTIPTENVEAECLPPEPQTVTLSDDLATEKLIDVVSSPPAFVSRGQSDAMDSRGVMVDLGHHLEEFNWQQADCNVVVPAVPDLVSLDEALSDARESPLEASNESKLISLDDVPPSDARESPDESSKESKLISMDDVPQSSNAEETSVKASEEIVPVDAVLLPSDTNASLVEISNESFTSRVDVLPPSSTVATPVQGLEESCAARTEEVWQKSVTDHEQNFNAESKPATTIDTASAANPVPGDNGQQVANTLDLGDAYKLAVGNRGRQMSGKLAEQWPGKDSSRLSEDLKLLVSQLSLARELSMNDSSPRVPISPRVPVSPMLSVNSDEVKTYDAANAIGVQLLQKRISLERNLSGQSFDGSIVSEIEGESVADRLKRQIEHDKRLLSALYKELEEERNASAIAANQAMAMITRVQEEKASLHMEALQCLRMMEEQAEYDSEALEKANDLLTMREKEIQDLESELEYYRDKFPDESIMRDTGEQVSGVKETAITLDSPDFSEDGGIISGNSVNGKHDKVEGTQVPSEEDKTGSLKDSLLQLEDEQLYILRSLKKLEKKLHLFSNSGLRSELANGKYSGNEGGSVNELEEGSELKSGAEENHASMQNDGGSDPAQGNVSSLEQSEFNNKETAEVFYSGQNAPLTPPALYLESLKNEVSDLNEKLEALEADRKFLENTINSIRTEEGLQLVQDIASHLKELRRIGIKRRKQSVA